MIRDFKNQQWNEDVQFYIGCYQENSLARGHNTLYVYGEPDIEEISRRLAQCGDEITHLVFGTMHSFKVSTYEDMENWVASLQHFLTLDYWCTLELDSTLINFVHETDLCSWNKFIPLTSVKIPYLNDLGYNAMIKIDDVEFNYSNHGVWTHSIHELTSLHAFTSWDDYKDDVVVSEIIDDKNDS